MKLIINIPVIEQYSLPYNLVVKVLFCNYVINFQRANGENQIVQNNWGIKFSREKPFHLESLAGIQGTEEICGPGIHMRAYVYM